MQKRNYQKELEQIIARLEQETEGVGSVPTLLLHSCCAPCSSYCLEYLSKYFAITIYYYNPNITEEAEYRLRVEEQKRLIAELTTVHSIAFAEGAYEPQKFLEKVKGLENEPEGGARCMQCFALRLDEAARMAALGSYDYVTTTLSISPLKNAEALNAIGEAAAKKWGVQYLPSDFKKKNGYKRSIELSKEHRLYRQSYCGCLFSREEAVRQGRISETPMPASGNEPENEQG